MKNTTHPASLRFGKPGVGTLLLATLWFGAGFSTAFAGGNDHWQQIAKRIDTQMTQALSHYRQGNVDAARGAVVKAYFSEFEDSKMEAAMRMELGAKATWEVEKMLAHEAICVTPHRMRRKSMVTSLILCAHSCTARY
jgi:hypothetical protein